MYRYVTVTVTRYPQVSGSKAAVFHYGTCTGINQHVGTCTVIFNLLENTNTVRYWYRHFLSALLEKLSVSGMLAQCPANG